MNANYESMYFVIANVFVFAIAIGIIWSILGSLGQRGAENILDHAPLLAGLTVPLVVSYFVYLQFYPDIYECDLTDGSMVTMSIDESKTWIEVGDRKLPASNVVECRPLVTSVSDRIERAIQNMSD